MATAGRPAWLRPVAGAGLALLAVRILRRIQTTQELFGQVVLITGSSRGLGLALARELAQHGCGRTEPTPAWIGRARSRGLLYTPSLAGASSVLSVIAR